LLWARVHNETKWRGRAREPELREGREDIPVDPNGFRTERVKRGEAVEVRTIYEGRRLKTTALLAEVLFDLQVTNVQTVGFWLGAGEPPLFSYEVKDPLALTFTVRAGHSLETDWCVAEITGVFWNTGPTRWHQLSTKGGRKKRHVDWGWAGEWEVKWEKHSGGRRK
jgi:hypothetical protein